MQAAGGGHHPGTCRRGRACAHMFVLGHLMAFGVAQAARVQHCLRRGACTHRRSTRQPLALTSSITWMMFDSHSMLGVVMVAQAVGVDTVTRAPLGQAAGRMRALGTGAGRCAADRRRARSSSSQLPASSTV